MVLMRADSAVMEVSSHALALHRVDGCEFDVAVFTNLTQDHLDFHGTMEAYQRAKLSLFEGLGADATKSTEKAAVINLDDPAAPVFLRAARTRHYTYSLTQQAEVAEGISELRHVPGRCERVEEGQEFGVMVDYAHTPDALGRVLEMARECCPGRLIVLFGCGGDRDRAKRPLMGEVALRLADFTVITSDNPRGEDPQQIIQEIEAGAKKGGGPGRGYVIISDRAMAIREVLSLAQRGDVVVIAGKGHETYQILEDRTIPFDDRQVAREALRELGVGGGGG